MIVKEAWKKREDYTHGLFGTKIYNSWRAIRFTLKGKRAGCCPEWKNFNHFVKDMQPSYIEGYALCRKDKTKPFSKDNCMWTHPTMTRATSDRLIRLEYKGKSQTLLEWAMELDISLTGLQQRYHAKNYSTEEILFGKKKKKRVWGPEQEIRTRASKMLNSYKNKDKRCGRGNNITVDWLIDNILCYECVYCGCTDRIGADRIDNRLGHVKGNLIPSCYQCNVIRGDKFSVTEMKEIGKLIKNILYQRKIVNAEK